MASPVRVEGLSELLRDLRDMDLVIDQAITRELAEGVLRWQDDLRGDGTAPGDGKRWPIGTTKRSKRTGRKYYVEPGTPGSDPSGRSLNAWEVKQGAGIVKASNRARDPRRGVEYAEWVHLRGRPTGSAVEDAWEHWEREFNAAAEAISRIVGDEIEGR